MVGIIGKKSGALMLLATIVVAVFVGSSSAATYTVGGSTGWTFPPSTNFYPTWASQQTFQVGDILVFNFAAGQHTVAPVSMASFDSCNVTDTLSPPLTNTPAQVTLTTAGTHYFICTFPGHCSSANQKLSVVVTAAAAPSPPPVSTPSRPTVAPQAARTPPPVSTPSPPTVAPQAAGTPPPVSTPSRPTVAPQAARTPPPVSTPAPPTVAPQAAGTPPPTTAAAASPPVPSVGTPPPTTADAASPPVPTTVGGAASTPPPSGNFAAPAAAGVGFLSAVSVVAAALLF